VLAALATAALVLAWNTQQRVKSLEAELVKRQQDSGAQATEARTLARQAELTSREAAAKLALLEARVAETTLQRSQMEELIQSLARSRDENVLADLDAAIRVAQQQSAITGSAEPLVLTLAAGRRTPGALQPAPPGTRAPRRGAGPGAHAQRRRDRHHVLTIRLDDVIRQVDDLPLLSAPERRPAPAARRCRRAPARRPRQPASAAAGTGWLGRRVGPALGRLWPATSGKRCAAWCA
jgi:uroporphyrin-3 C-methyltransferase